MHVSITPSAPIDATYITQTANGVLTAEQNLAALATGLVKNTTTSGVLSIGLAGTDYQAPGLCVLKAGDTMTGLLTYAQPSSTDAKFYAVNPNDGDAKLFNWNLWTSDNVGSARDNVGLNWGYNQASGGGREDSADQAFYQQLETFYQPASEAQFEYHWDFVDGAGVNLRPMHLNCVRANGNVNMYWTSDNTYWISAADTNLVQAQIFGAATLAGMEWINYIPTSIRIDGTALAIRNTANDIALTISTVTGAARGAIASNCELAFGSTVIAGVRLNNLTTTQRDALTPAVGMTIYNTTDSRMQGYIGSAWATLYSVGGTDVAIADGGTGQSTAQLGINALTNVAAATNEWVLTKDTATGNAVFKAAAGGGGTPGGSDTQVQFNDGGAFGGDSLLLWDKTNNRLNVGTTMTEDGTLRLPAGSDSAPAIVFPSSDPGLPTHTGIFAVAANDTIVIQHYNSTAQTRFGYGLINCHWDGFFPQLQLNGRIVLQEEADTQVSLAKGYSSIVCQAELSISRTLASTNTVITWAQYGRASSGSPAAGMGGKFQFYLSITEAGSFTYEAGVISFLWNDAGESTRKPDYVLNLIDYTASREIMRGRANGSAAAIGFLGAAPVARQTHIADPSGGGTTDAEARTAINSILDVLEAFGLVAT